MSYDVTLFRPPEGVDTETAYQQLMKQEELECTELGGYLKRPVPETTRAEMQRIADLLRAARPGFVQFQPASPLPWIELNNESLQFQVSIQENSIGMTFPYFMEDMESVLNEIFACLAVLQAERFVAYDPQLGRGLTESDRGEVLKMYREVDRAWPAILGQLPEAVEPSKKPWWKFW